MSSILARLFAAWALLDAVRRAARGADAVAKGVGFAWRMASDADRGLAETLMMETRGRSAPFEPGAWVRVKPEHDIPELFRPGGPTTGRVHEVVEGIAEVWISIDGAPVDEHSQAVPYPVEQLELVRGPREADRGA